MGELLLLVSAMMLGMIFKKIGLPALVGYLITGFVAFYISGTTEALYFNQSLIENAAHIGVLILLFTVGLKIEFDKIFRIEVVGTTLIHFTLSTLLTAPAFYYLADLSIEYSLLLAGLLTLSSTVLAARVLETKLELKSYHGRLAIGMLIFQDIIAMAILSVYGDSSPSTWTLLLLIILALRPLIFKLIDWSGHDEMLLLTVITIALGVGGYGFDAAGLTGELGALAMGALIAKHDKANEIAEKLWGIKELCLVAFFLSIGMKGLPNLSDVTFASFTLFALPLQGALLFATLLAFKIKSRPAFLTTTTLTNYSEFGLIVTALVLPEYAVMIAIAVSMSFLISAPINSLAHPLYDRFESFLKRFERKCDQTDDTPVSLGNAEVVVMGMGRVGRSTYNALVKQGVDVIGLDSDNEKISSLKGLGYNVGYADGEHGNFWEKVELNNIVACVLCMNCSEATITVTERLRKRGYDGYIIAHSHFKDEAEAINKAGADDTYLTYSEAGQGLASHTLTRLADHYMQ
tara:strand:- start:4540 stop:6096 length:1557 start_codon:yes stop_codon:yes gene_type:complete